MTKCSAYHHRRTPEGRAFETITCKAHDRPGFHQGHFEGGAYTWPIVEGELIERSRMALAGSPWMAGVNEGNAAEVLARNTSQPAPDRICETCGDTFPDRYRNHLARFCSDACRFGWVA